MFNMFNTTKIVLTSCYGKDIIVFNEKSNLM